MDLINSPELQSAIEAAGHAHYINNGLSFIEHFIQIFAKNILNIKKEAPFQLVHYLLVFIVNDN